MDSIPGTELRCTSYGDKGIQIGMETYQFGEEEFQKLIMAPESGNSFTALLELPANQAMELLHSSSEAEDSPGCGDVLKRHRISAYSHTLHCSLPTFPSNRALIERAARYSVFATDDSSEPSNSSMKVKAEPLDSGSNPNSSDPTVGSGNEKPLKRKEREKKGKGSSKKSKTIGNQSSEDDEKLPYVHVRARRGQATDSHSLAERARREKINARMKLLQELVPGCNKISGTALVLDEIINHVQSLQRQVEYLSMRLAAVNPRVDFNIDGLFSAGTESTMECNFPNMTMPVLWPEAQVNGGDRQPFQLQWHFESLNQPVWVKEEDNRRNLITPENSLLSYDSSPNSASLRSSQLKMEL